MKKTVLKFFIIFIFNLLVHVPEAADVISLCGDDTWVTYEDEKCVKLFQTYATGDQAEGICNQQGLTSSIPTLVIIRSAAEQKFLSEYILSVSEFDNVWIGAQRIPDSATEFEWNDGTIFERFTNWAIDRPTNDTRRSCVQMKSELSRQTDMAWGDVACGTVGWFLCQKLQAWSLQHLQEVVLDARREVQYLQDNPIPIGFIYVQLHNQPESMTLWPTVEWSEITASYAGLFFRAEGEGSEPFGSIQTENIPRLTGTSFHYRNSLFEYSIGIPTNGGESQVINTGWTVSGGLSLFTGLSFSTTGGEVRPRNTLCVYGSRLNWWWFFFCR